MLRNSMLQKTIAAFLAVDMMLSTAGCGVSASKEINSADSGQPADAALHTSGLSITDSSITGSSITKNPVSAPDTLNPEEHSIKKNVQDARINKIKSNYETFCEQTLYPFLSDQWGDNPQLSAPVYSPVSLYLHLSMLSELSDGETKEEILTLLGKKNISTDLIKYAASEHCAIANSVWLDDISLYNKDVLSKTAKTYHAEIFNGPMGRASYDRQINQWLTKQLHSKSIENLPTNIKTIKGIMLLLLSTINLEDHWNSAFDEKLTTEEVFYGQNLYTCGNTTEEEKIDKVSCPFLHGTRIESAMENETFQAIRLPMKEHSLILVLPKEKASIETILGKKKGTDLLKLCDPEYKNWELQEVDFSMPKLNLTSDYDLIPLLNTLGIEKLFQIGEADFSPILVPNYNQKYEADIAVPYIDIMRQASTVIIDENGCRVKSIAETGIKEGCPLPEKKMTMHCNRPFFYIVINNESLPLFMGTVNRIEKDQK